MQILEYITDEVKGAISLDSLLTNTLDYNGRTFKSLCCHPRCAARLLELYPQLSLLTTDSNGVHVVRKKHF
jgi:hypothetical protein